MQKKTTLDELDTHIAFDVTKSAWDYHQTSPCYFNFNDQPMSRDLSNLCPFFGRRLSFIREKSDSKAIVFAAWGLGMSIGGLSGVKRSKQFWRFNIFKAIKWLITALKNYVYDPQNYASS